MEYKNTVEQPITFNEAARFLPAENRPSYSTWWRWWRKGVKGIRLRTLVIGGRRYTTESAVQEFIAGTTAAASGERPPTKTPKRRQRNIAKAEVEVFGKNKK